ncbi:MAG: RIP metalloprotease RseP [Erythrobacter sp.]
MFDSPPFWMYIIGFLLVLGPLITVHELGHYLVGRWLGVGADIFSVGMGKEIVGRTDRRGTRWRFSAIPLGGYVQFKGDMNPASIPDPDAPADTPQDAGNGSFQHAALWKRALIVLAGPMTNLIVAIGIFAAFFAIFGNPVIDGDQDDRMIGQFTESSVARDAGLEVGDVITAIDGEELPNFEALKDQIAPYPGKDITVTAIRDGKAIQFPLTVATSLETDKFGNSAKMGRIGVGPGQSYVFEDVGIGTSVALGAEQCWRIVKMMATGIKQIVTGERSIKELGGPIKIAKYSGEQLSLGLIAFVNFAALISLNLAFINLLPIPALDGGHLAFYAAEAVRRKPVGPRTMEYAYMGGMAFVLMFMVVVTFNDLVSLPIFGS